MTSRWIWVFSFGALACGSPGEDCGDMVSMPCFAEISDGCCTTEATPNAAVCRDGRLQCPDGLLAEADCPAIAGQTCELQTGVPGPGGEIGVCCPVADFVGCSPGAEPLPAGGWAPSFAECTLSIQGFDGQPYERRFEWGCAVLREDTDAAPCGSIATDAGTDAGTGDAGTGDAGTGDAGTGDAGPATDAGPPVDCSGATRVNDDTCDVPGCVPTTAPTGAPPVSPECVALTDDSCTVFCRRAAPPCPAGTVPEGDGFCYTDRCIPASACP